MTHCIYLRKHRGFPGGSAVKNPLQSRRLAGDMASIPGPGRSPGGGHDNPLGCSYLENLMDREASWAIVHRVTKESDTT